MVYDNDPDWIFGDDGAILTALKAIKDGKVRYLGFTGHKDPVIHLKMLSKPYEWATVQMPLNVMDAHYRSFQHNVLPELVKRGIGPLGMKSLGGAGKIVSEAGVSIEDALRYVLSLPIAALVSGIDSEKVLEQNLKIVRNFTPLSEDEKDRIESSVMKSPATAGSSCSRARSSTTARCTGSSTGSIPTPRRSDRETSPRRDLAVPPSTGRDREVASYRQV